MLPRKRNAKFVINFSLRLSLEYGRCGNANLLQILCTDVTKQQDDRQQQLID